MPDEHTTPAEIDPAASPGESAGEVANQGDGSNGASAPQPAKSASSLITAVEIENFKGIGRPVRIDLRPVTLLFGRNSAGKSTVLHALCYAHEILSHRNVDAHKTELGGDQVDLGGFRNFVHAHDLTRKVRLRFELNLRGQSLPDLAGLGADMPILPASMFEDPLGDAQCGWVEMTVQWYDRWLKQTAIISSFEVGVDEQIVGRIAAGSLGTSYLSANLSHPRLNCEELKDAFTTTHETNRVNETDRSERHVPRLHRFSVFLPSALPSFQQHLLISPGNDLVDRMNEANGFDPVYGDFEFRVSTLVVGVGSLLRDELAQLRYLGPLRDLHPRDDGELGGPNARRWADGSVAWHSLTNDAHSDSKVLNDTSDWLSRKDRLDTGYKLRAPSVVELPGDDPLVTKILALKSMERRGVNPRNCGQEAPESPGDIVTAADPQQVIALADRIAGARVRKEVQIVATETDLPVRTSDIGVGVSQILPVVVAALDPDRPGITAIEQPELHVHPRIQVELGDLFAQRVDQGGVFLIETHSEHLMLRLLRRIEETHGEELPEGKPSLKPDQVSVVFVEQVGSEVRATRLRIDETGEFKDRWPQGFFDERVDELF